MTAILKKQTKHLEQNNSFEYITGLVETHLDQQKAVLFCLFYKDKDLLDEFIPYHFKLGFSYIVIINFDDNSDLSAYAKKYKDITIYSVKPSEEKDFSKDFNLFQEKIAKEIFSLTLEANEFFHYQYPEIISLENYISFINNHNFKALNSYKVTLHKPKKLNSKEFFLDFYVNLDSIEIESKDHARKTLSGTSVVFKLLDPGLTDVPDLKKQRQLFSKNEIISYFIEEGACSNPVYEQFVEKQVLDNFKLKDYVTKYAEECDEKNYAYRRFVVLGRPRSGTNLLCSLLDSHPSIQCAPELFNKRRIYSTTLDCVSDKVLLTFRTYNPRYFLRRFLWHDNYDKKIWAVGFKLLDSHLEAFPDLEEIVLKEKNSRVVIARRKNCLARLYSYKQATLFDRWTIVSEGDRVNARIKLSTKECEQFFKKDEKFYGQLKKKLQDYKMKFIEIIYEDLYTDLDSETMRLTKFLGFKPRVLNTSLKKQNIKLLSEVIINYKELKNHFSGTKWEDLFEN